MRRMAETKENKSLWSFCLRFELSPLSSWERRTFLVSILLENIFSNKNITLVQTPPTTVLFPPAESCRSLRWALRCQDLSSSSHWHWHCHRHWWQGCRRLPQLFGAKTVGNKPRASCQRNHTGAVWLSPGCLACFCLAKLCKRRRRHTGWSQSTPSPPSSSPQTFLTSSLTQRLRWWSPSRGTPTASTSSLSLTYWDAQMLKE